MQIEACPNWLDSSDMVTAAQHASKGHDCLTRVVFFFQVQLHPPETSSCILCNPLTYPISVPHSSKPHRRLRRNIPQIPRMQIRCIDQHIRTMLRMLQTRAVPIQIHASPQIPLVLLPPDVSAVHGVLPYRRVVVKRLDPLRHGLEVKFFFPLGVVEAAPVDASFVVLV